MFPNFIYSHTSRVAECDKFDRDSGQPDLRNPALHLIGCDQIDLAQDDEWLYMAFVCHHKVSVEPYNIEIVMTGLNNERNVDICRDHLEVYYPAGTLATQERLPGQDLMNDCHAAGVVVFYINPVADTRQSKIGLSRELEFPCKFGGNFLVFISDDACAPVNCCYPGNSLIWSAIHI